MSSFDPAFRKESLLLLPRKVRKASVFMNLPWPSWLLTLSSFTRRRPTYLPWDLTPSEAV